MPTPTDLARATGITPSTALPTVSQVLLLYQQKIPVRGNYVRVAKAYLKFCLAQGFPLSPYSFDLHTAGQKPNLVSTLRKFARFAEKMAILWVAPDPTPPPFVPVVNEWILRFLSESLTLRGDRSKDTYAVGLNRFFAFLESEGRPLGALTVNAFVAHLRAKQRSAFTINSYLAAVKQFCSWIIRSRERLGLDLTAAQLDSLRDVALVPGLRIERRYYKEGLETVERDRLHAGAESPRERAMLMLMSLCGLRTVELTRLRVGDIDWDHQQVHVLGKGQATRKAVKLFAECRQALTDYWPEVKDSATQAPLFPGLTTRRVRYLTVKRLAGEGLRRKGVSAHSLRHTAGQQLLAQGVDVLSVQRQLRHQRPDTTQFYLQQRVEKDFFDKLPD